MHFKKITIIVFTILITMVLHAQQATVDDIGVLTASNINEETVFVKDLARGGTFVFVKTGASADKGVVFTRKGGGYWIRSFNKAQGVNPCWWGARGDGTNDDLPALNAATAYCLKNETIMQFPSGVFRITGQWVIGGKTLQEKDLFAGQLSGSASFDMDQHGIARRSSPVIIRGGVRTCIYGDFLASKLTAIIYYNIRAMGMATQPSARLYTHEFSNIGIYGQGSFNGTTATPADSVNMNNQQIGLVILFCTNPVIKGCSFSGLKYGLVFKTSYFGSVSNCAFELCETGMHTTDYNSNLIENVVGSLCKVLVDLTGSQVVVNNLNAEFCETALIFKGANVVFNGIYCENFNLKRADHYQLIFGHNKWEPGYDPKAVTSGIVINGLTIGSGGRDAILLEEDVKQVDISVTSLYGNIVTTSAGNTVMLNNANGSFKITGPGKWERK